MTLKWIKDFTSIPGDPLLFSCPMKDDQDFKVSGDMGTFTFLAPEVHLKPTFKPKPLDVWALGVSIYTVVFGRVPFFVDSDSKLDLIKAITES